MPNTASLIMPVKTETIVGIVLVLLLAMVQLATCDLIIITEEGQASSPQVFRILVVEATITKRETLEQIPMRSGQHLIKTLLEYINWNNQTIDQYISYIHLLSRYSESEVFEECRPFWQGNSTKENMRNEILDFLGSAVANETVILYYNGHGGKTLVPDEIISSAELTSWLSSVDPEAHLCIIFDHCRSGFWIDDGSGGVLGSNRIVLCASMSGQISWGWTVSAWCWFTGREETRYRNGTRLPLGVIGGLFAGNDTNDDGWISMMECFAFAKPSVEQYSSQEDEYWTDLNCSMNPVAYNGIGQDIPFVKLPEALQADFIATPEKPTTNQTIIFNASTSEGVISEYTWDFGDNNETTVSTPTITHRYEQPGNYTVTLTISNSITNSTSKTITVYYVTDLNQDRTVNIVDVSIVSMAYGTKPGDEHWNEACDMNDDYTVNIVDLSIVTMDYGKTV